MLFRILAPIVALCSAVGGCAGQSPTDKDVATELAVSDSPEIGRYVTDARGRPVYTLAGGAKCDESCAREWPPVLGGSMPVPVNEPAIQTERLGSVTRQDGTLQLSYGGYPLHYRANFDSSDILDRSVTDRWGTWSLLFPHGERMVP